MQCLKFGIHNSVACFAITNHKFLTPEAKRGILHYMNPNCILLRGYCLISKQIRPFTMEPLAYGLQICHTSNIPQSSAVLDGAYRITQEPNDICIINEPWPSATDDMLLSPKVIGHLIIDVVCWQAVRDGAGAHWDRGQSLKRCII